MTKCRERERDRERERERAKEREREKEKDRENRERRERQTDRQRGLSNKGNAINPSVEIKHHSFILLALFVVANGVDVISLFLLFFFFSFILLLFLSFSLFCLLLFKGNTKTHSKGVVFVT